MEGFSLKQSSRRKGNRSRLKSPYGRASSPPATPIPAPVPLVLEFAAALPARTGEGKAHQSLDHRQMRYILWAKAEGMKRGKIADDLGIPPGTISNFLRKARRDAEIFVTCRFVEPVPEGDGKSYRWVCKMCLGWYRKYSLAANHAYEVHLFGGVPV